MSKEDSTSSPNRVFGGPTKRFFIEMLPRDIKLEDAILDLVDNSVDGAIRTQRDKLQQQTPFKGFFAKLSISDSGFEITDNCGGIPKDYIDAAFSLGRPSIEKDGDLPTIGMYGIGMKRAVFKIGKEALVQSNSSDGYFEVTYSKKWMEPDNDDWDLPIKRSKRKAKDDLGVTVLITDLRREINKQFRSEAFINRVRNLLSEHFGYIMQRGFSISLNSEVLKPKTLTLHSVQHSEAKAIRPFDYATIVNGVDIKVTVGFFRGLIRDKNVDDELYGPKTKDVAGISVVCNDRVILLGDQSMITGWGDGSVPKYHPQFRAIAGLVVFSSVDANQLPISTTKRDLDVGSEVYLRARKALMEGLKAFTDFTNKWKGMEDEADQYFIGTNIDAKKEILLAKTAGKNVRGEPASKKYVPDLPLPTARDPRRRITFLKKQSDVDVVSRYLFGEPDVQPATIGEECFERILKEAQQ